MPSRRRHRAGDAIKGRRLTPAGAGDLAGLAGPAAGGALRLLIDGRNVQRALERGAAGGSLPTASLIARLRAAFAPPTEVELILDGHPGGSPTGRVAPGFAVVYSRHAIADQVIGDRVAAALRELGPTGAWSVVVVSDDREVQEQARRHGARAQGTAWLATRLATSGRAGASIGRSISRSVRPPSDGRDLG